METSTLLQFYVFLVAVPSVVFSGWIYFDRRDQEPPTTGQGIGSFSPPAAAALFLTAGLSLGWLGWVLAYLSYRSTFATIEVEEPLRPGPSAGDAAEALLRYKQQFDAIPDHHEITTG